MANKLWKTLPLLASSGLFQLLVVQAAWSQDSPVPPQSPPSVDAPVRPRPYRAPRSPNSYRRGDASDPSARVAMNPPQYGQPMEETEGPPMYVGGPQPQFESSSMYDVVDPKYGGPEPNYFAHGCGSCGGGGCGSCNDGCGSCNHGCFGPFYVRGEYLSWWLKGFESPPLVTTGPPTADRTTAGVLGQDGTSILVGNDAFGAAGRSGGRLVAGWWIDPTMRIEAEGFVLATARSSEDLASTDGATILARPFFNLGTGAQASNVISFPAQNTGSINVSTTSSFVGAGVHATQNLAGDNFCYDRHYRVDFLYGYRYLNLKERLNVNSSSTSINPAGPIEVGTNFTAGDSFSTSNNFNGFDLGVMAESRLAHWCLTTIGRLGIGGTSERVSINGSSTATVPDGTAVTNPGGLLALPSNIGTYHRNAFALVPQLELKLAYDLTSRVRFTIGYDLIYWSRVVRPGDQMDLFVNTSQAGGQTLSGTPGPLFAFRESDLWVQGISVGGECRF